MLITIKSAKAAQRPLAAIGMGANLCDGLVDSGFGAALALPRVKRAAAATSEWHAATGTRDAGDQVSTQATTGIQAKSAQFAAHQPEVQQFNAPHHNYMTRVSPVFQGGVGPHPAREPEPV